MGKGSKAPTTTTSNVNQSSLPEYARPYYERLMARTEAESNQPYAMYQGPRIQGFTPDTESAFQGYRNLAAYGNPTVDQAVGLTGVGAGMAAQGMAPIMRGVGTTSRGVDVASQGLDPMMRGVQSVGFGEQVASQGLMPMMRGVGATSEAMRAARMMSEPVGQGAGTIQRGTEMAMRAGDYSPMMAGTGEWGGRAANRYMSPYIQNVLDVQKRRAGERYQEQQGNLASAAKQAGALGGSRHGIQSFLAEREMNQQLNDMEAQALSQAYQNAQQMYTSDQARRLQADLANQGVDLQGAQLRMQGGQAGIQGGQALGQLGGQYGQMAQIMGQLGGQYGQLGSQMGGLGGVLGQMGGQYGQLGSQMGGLGGQLGQLGGQYGQLGTQMGGIGGQVGQLAGQMGQLGGTQQQLYMDRLKSLMGIGTAQQDLAQRGLDIAREDFINQRDYERGNLAFLGGIMRGVPVTPQSEIITTSPGPNMLSQMLGAGIAGSQLANMGRGG